jgi:hypothetical protein
MRRSALPGELRGLAIRTVEGDEYGLPRSRLRRADVAHPFHGVSALDVDLSTVIGRCTSFEPLLLAGQFFSHVTAALLFGAPLPVGSDVGSLDVAVLDPRTPPRGRGVTAHRVTGVEVVLRHGLPTVSPADAWCELALLLRPADLIAVGDHLVTGRRTGSTRAPALASIQDLRDAVRRHRGKRGSRVLGWAVERVRSGVDSRPETLLRLLLVEAGLPEPELGIEVDVGGGLMLHPDLAYPTWKVTFEYEGDGHRTDRKLWRRDIERRELFEAAGWRVIRVTGDDIVGAPDVFLRRVHRIIAAR